MNKATAKVICDAGPIIHLDELESVHLLSDFREVLVGPYVRAEIAQFRPLALAKIDQFKGDLYWITSRKVSGKSTGCKGWVERQDNLRAAFP